MRLISFSMVIKRQLWTNRLTMMLWLEEEKCAIMPTDLNICLYCRAKVTQLPGVKSGCTIYCGLQAVACGFPVFVMVETEQKGFLGCGPQHF